MIGKQIKGTGFRGCLNYVLGKKDATLIGGTMCGQTSEELAAEFAIARQLRPNLKVAVFGIADSGYESTFRLMLQNSSYLVYSNWEILNSYLYSATPSFSRHFICR